MISVCLNGTRFRDIEDIQNNVTKAQEFQKYFQKWAKYIVPEGEYFEGDPSQ
jgi:hypothetical protein